MKNKILTLFSTYSIDKFIRANDSIIKEQQAGAGDTFFGAFISQYITTKETLLSSQYATNQTSIFLKNKK